MQIKKSEILQKLTINPDRRKCFIFDLDGTIIFKNQFLSKEIESLLYQIKDAGHELIFATGRPLREFKLVMPEWTHTQPLSLFSGCVSVIGDKLIRSKSIQENLIPEISDICVKNNFPFIMDNLTHYYHPPMKNMVLGILDKRSFKYHVSNLEQMLGTEIYKVLIFDMQAHEQFLQYAEDKQLLIKHHSYDDCFDIVPQHCNKYLGVEPFITDFANEDVFVFGNDFNDLELLRHFNNSVLFGDIAQLQKITKLNLLYNEFMSANFVTLIKTILEPSVL